MVGRRGDSTFRSLLAKCLLHGSKKRLAWLVTSDDGESILSHGPLVDAIASLGKFVPTICNADDDDKQVEEWKLDRLHVASVKRFITSTPIESLLENVGKGEIKNMAKKLARKEHKYSQFANALKAARQTVLATAKEQQQGTMIGEMLPFQDLMAISSVRAFITDKRVRFEEALLIYGYFMVQGITRAGRQPNPPRALLEDAVEQRAEAAEAIAGASADPGAALPVPQASSAAATTAEREEPTATLSAMAAHMSQAVSGQPDLNVSMSSVARGLQAVDQLPYSPIAGQASPVNVSDMTDESSFDQQNPPARAAEVIAANEILQAQINADCRTRRAEATQMHVKVLKRLDSIVEVASSSFTNVNIVRGAMEEMSASIQNVAELQTSFEAMSARQERMEHRQEQMEETQTEIVGLLRAIHARLETNPQQA